jgi:hypothetical protein
VYFLCVPLLLHFAVFFSFSAMLAVATRSTVPCVFGSVVCWLLCWGVNFGRHAALTVTELQGSPPLGTLIESAYWILPKPLDFHFVLLEALGGESLFGPVAEPQMLSAQGAWHPGLSLLSSLAAGVVLLGLAAYDFMTTDY